MLFVQTTEINQPQNDNEVMPVVNRAALNDNDLRSIYLSISTIVAESSISDVAYVINEVSSPNTSRQLHVQRKCEIFSKLTIKTPEQRQ